MNRSYAHSHEQILEQFKECLVHHERMSGVFSPALGDYGYLIRSPDLEVIHACAAYIHELNG